MHLAHYWLELSRCRALRGKDIIDLVRRRRRPPRRRPASPLLLVRRCLGDAACLPPGFTARPPGEKLAENSAAVKVKFLEFKDGRRAGRAG